MYNTHPEVELGGGVHMSPGAEVGAKIGFKVAKRAEKKQTKSTNIVV